MGARLVLVARDRRRGEETLKQLAVCGTDVMHRVHYGDLSRLAEMKQVGAEIAAAEPKIDVLINNAGAMFGRRQVTEDGLERTFATNHMAYFVLTHLLRDRLVAAAPARVVCTASGAHKGEVLDFSDLQMAKGYHVRTAYGRSKLANILFTRELARRLAGTGVTANCLHPGFVRTGFGQREGGWFALVMRLAMRFGGAPEPGADTIVYLASSPEVANVSGGYFRDCRPIDPSSEAKDDEVAGRLWTESARIAGIV